MGFRRKPQNSTIFHKVPYAEIRRKFSKGWFEVRSVLHNSFGFKKKVLQGSNECFKRFSVIVSSTVIYKVLQGSTRFFEVSKSSYGVELDNQGSQRCFKVLKRL